MRRILLIAALLLSASVRADLTGITSTPINSPNYVDSATSGPDGNIWFVMSDANAVAKSTLSGTLTTFPVPTANAGLADIKMGPDGNLWFTEPGAGKIGRITVTGTITEFPVSGLAIAMNNGTLEAGPDNNMWFVANALGKITATIGRISTSGASVSAIALPGTAPFPRVRIARGPNNAMWFHDLTNNTVGSITASGAVQSFSFKTPETNGGSFAAGGMATGSDGNLWTSHSKGLARVTPSGTITEYPVPGGQVIGGVANGADNNIWFVDNGTGNIGRLIVSTATDAGTATIDQSSVLGGGPADIFPISSPSGSSRVVPNSTCPPITFLIKRNYPTPPPNMFVVTMATECADLGASFQGIGTISTRFWGFNTGSVYCIIRNDGPNDAVPIVNVSTSTNVSGSDYYVDYQYDLNMHGVEKSCGSGKIVGRADLSCVGDDALRPGETANARLTFAFSPSLAPTVVATFIVSSNLPDQNPTNNVSSGTANFDTITSKVLPADINAPSDPLRRH